MKRRYFFASSLTGVNFKAAFTTFALGCFGQKGDILTNQPTDRPTKSP
jgi:hypothetical protein